MVKYNYRSLSAIDMLNDDKEGKSVSPAVPAVVEDEDMKEDDDIEDVIVEPVVHVTKEPTQPQVKPVNGSPENQELHADLQVTSQQS